MNRARLLALAALIGACGPAAVPSPQTPGGLDAQTAARYRRAEEALRADGGGDVRAVAHAGPYVFVLREDGSFSPIFAVPDTDPAVPVATGLTFHEESTVVARAIPIDGHDELAFVELRAELSSEGSRQARTRYVVLRTASNSVACTFLGDESTEYAEPMAGLPQQTVAWSIDDQAEELTLVVRVRESHRNWEAHQRESTWRYVLSDEGPCARTLVELRSNDPADYVDAGLPVPAGLAGEGRADLGPLAAAVADDASFARLLDPRRGLIYVEVFEDASGEDTRAGPDGVVRIAERLCGDALAQRAARLREDLARRVEDAEAVRLRCVDLACTHDAFGEYDLTGEYRFVEADGGPKLIEVVRIEGGPVLPEWVAAQRAWARAELARLREAGPCPGPD